MYFTPLHHACWENNLGVIRTLLNESNRYHLFLHNIKYGRGATPDERCGQKPLFSCKSSSALEIFLSADLEDLELVDLEGHSLLSHCINTNILSEDILRVLNNQMFTEFWGKSPISLVLRKNNLEACLMLMRASPRNIMLFFDSVFDFPAVQGRKCNFFARMVQDETIHLAMRSMKIDIYSKLCWKRDTNLFTLFVELLSLTSEDISGGQGKLYCFNLF
jgi:hypothetical protein